MAFYEKEDAILRDDENEGADPGDLEVWDHRQGGWMPYGMLLQQLDRTTYRTLDDEEVEALIEAGPGPMQPESAFRERR